MKTVRSRMKTVAILAVLAVVPSAAAITACGSSAPPTCRQQYQAWKTGPSRSLAEDMAAKLNVYDLPGAGKDAGKLQAYPMPACADPAHYYTRLLTDLQRMGNTGIIGAMGMQSQINTDLSDLNSELTAGHYNSAA